LYPRAARISASSTGSFRASVPPTTSPAVAPPSWSKWSRPRPFSIRPGPRALVILDEIGRGTATFDGLSIAWATLEHLHEHNRCRTLFATHFHELTALSARLNRLVNTTVRVKEFQGDVVFLHEVTAGVADRSYGVQVAKLAGLPAAVSNARASFSPNLRRRTAPPPRAS
jgi:DNA mismatch repair ATPase MutS